ncbi:hypothetical protein [Butyricicoccus pullicaecorum]|uniref:hypothetical protein n=1 Tax=Butyricicoccus pullicaecorum TaxID=501571 RepID=UPI0039908BDA
MYLNFTKIHSLPVSGHRAIDFVDVPINTDAPLYMDVERIMHDPSFIAEQARIHINDFFHALAQAAAAEDMDTLYHLLSYGGEPNETHLGLSRYNSRGNGVSAEILMPIIEDMIQLGLFEKKLVQGLSDLHLLTPRFGSDRLSDLVTNIIRIPLYAFTRSQYNTWGIPYDDGDRSYKCPAWDPEQHDWVITNLPCFQALGKPVLLTPKTFVGTTLLSTPEQLFCRYALAYAQEQHLAELGPLCTIYTNREGKVKVRKPSKKVLQYDILQHESYKQYIYHSALSHPEMLPNYRQDVQTLAASGDVFLSDSELDNLLYYHPSRMA